LSIATESTESTEYQSKIDFSESFVENRFLPFMVKIEKLDENGKVKHDIEGAIISNHWILAAGHIV